jgi:3-oxoacyl-[acyl-carrier protein] reductase
VSIIIDLSEKTALITGATRGIGKSIANYFHNAGANLILTGTKFDDIEKLNLENIKLGINNCKYIQADFSDPISMNNFLNKIESYKQIDICVNNAGVNRIDDFIDTTIEDFNWVNEINVTAPYKILKIVGPKMIENNYGRIINVASIWSVVNRRGRSIYSESKNAIVGLTKALAVEWAQHNVLVNAVSPGFILTELTKTTNTKKQLEEIRKVIPSNRLADPDEVARFVIFLCSELNTYLTGQNIVIDGGYSNL